MGDISVGDAFYELYAELSSEDDPVIFRGQETNLYDLMWLIEYGNEELYDYWNRPAKRLPLGFWGKNSDGTVTYRHSNLLDMLVDRREWEHANSEN